MRWGRLAPVAAVAACAFAGTAAAAWRSGIYTGTLRNPGYGTRGSTPIRLLVTKTNVRVVSASLSFRCPSAKKRVTAKIGPVKPKPLQGVLDASRDTPAGVCEDSALLTAKPR